MGNVPTNNSVHAPIEVGQGQDAMHFTGPGGGVLSWIDSQGFGQGNLFNSGGGGGISGSTVTPNLQAIYASPNCPIGSTNCFFVNANTQYCLDATITITSKNVTSAGECTWTSADIGKTFFATNKGAFGETPLSVNLFPVGTTITAINSPTSIQVSNAATTGCTPANPNSACIAVYGTDDTANLNAAWAATGNGQGCNSLVLPAGNMLFTPPLFTVVPSGSSKCLYVGGVSNTPHLSAIQNNAVSISGQGNMTTTLIPNPVASNGLTSLCTGGGSGAACVGGITGVIFHDLAINGLGQNSLGSNAVNLIELYTGGLGTYNVVFADWDAGDSNANNVGVAIGNYAFLSNAMVVGWGRTGAQCAAGPCWVSNSWLNGGVSSFVCTAGATAGAPCFSSFNTFFAGTASSGAGIALWNKGYLISNEDFIFDSNPTAGHAEFSNTGGSSSIARFTNLTMKGGNIATATAMVNTASQTIHCYACTIATNIPTGLNNAGSFYDEGGNSFSVATTPYTGAGSVFGSLSITGVAAVATNITASTGWGTTGAAGNGISGVSGNTQTIQFTITTPGSGQGANPTIVITFPSSFFVAPRCFLNAVGGTGITSAVPLTVSTGPSTTGVTYTYIGTPASSSTFIFVSTCQNY